MPPSNSLLTKEGGAMKTKLPSKPGKQSGKLPVRVSQAPAVSSRRKTLALFTMGAWGAAHGLALPRTALAQSASYKVGVKTLSFSTTNPKPGQIVSISMVVTTAGRGKRSVPWELLVNNKRIAGGVERNVVAGRSFTKRISWRATAGLNNFLAKADPKNTFRESGRDRNDNARRQSVRVSAPAATQQRGRSTTTQRSTTRQTGKPANAITVKVSSFSISPSAPKYGEPANLRLKFKVDGSGQKDVEWIIRRGSSTLASGIQRNARAGQNYTINKSWNANIGAHTFGAVLDPNRKLGEPSNLRSDNVKTLTVNVVAEWARWGNAAFAGAVDGVRLWQAQARFTGIKVMAIAAIGTPGVLKGPSIKNSIKNKMKSEGCPDAIADKFAVAVANSWKFWQDRVSIPSLPWYPAFAAFPGPQAPPTPNVPVPLAALPSAGASGLTSNSLKSAINNKLGSVKNQPGAQPAITSFATQFSTRFTIWRASQAVTNVLGRGPIPTFAPPYVPVGPVVNGSAQSAPGAALRSKPF
jgi:hypothetical protein